ncbi:MAG: hypothetical protein H6704_14935 [Myxococcales bacterium]|nr:hypothetical protein [Myxococcales bacterium]
MADNRIPPELLSQRRALVEGARIRAAGAVNSALVGLDWQVGKRLREEVLGDERSACGEQLVAEVAGVLGAGFGRGFGSRSLPHGGRLAEALPGKLGGMSFEGATIDEGQAHPAVDAVTVGSFDLGAHR